jgi:signal transduction histidine kinase
MFVWEGSILLGTIMIGGAALVIFSYRDQKRHQRLRFFFSTFSHDIKTSIARLRLQAEVLEEDPQSNNPVLKRLVEDIRRLDLQLENSLFLATLEDHAALLQEKVSLSQLLSTLRNDFPELSLELEKDALIQGDRRALISIFRNLLQNSVLHGKATEVKIAVRSSAPNTLELIIADNGQGFKGFLPKLGSEILISQDSRGNGIGLLISKRLLNRMGGNLSFESKENEGFKSHLNIGGTLT